jgi:hypothetical protein
MLILPGAIAMVIGPFAPMFSKHILEHVKLLVVGAILAPIPWARHIWASKPVPWRACQ